MTSAIADAPQPTRNAVADDYASDLLLPRYLLEPMLKGLSRPALKYVKEIAEAFDTSLTATVLKIIETDRFPIMLVSHSQQGRAWFRKSAERAGALVSAAGAGPRELCVCRPVRQE